MNLFSCRWLRTAHLQSETASPLPASSARIEFAELITIKTEAQEYQEHAQFTKKTSSWSCGEKSKIQKRI